MDKRVPEVRFKGFTDDWEQRKLGDSLDSLKDGTHGSHVNVKNGPFLLSAKNIKKGKVIKNPEQDRMISVEEYDDIRKSFELQKKDILLTIVGSIGESAILTNPDNIVFQRSVAFLRVNKYLYPDFLYMITKNVSFKRELKNRQTVSAQPGIYLNDLSEIPISFPILEEQIKLSKFLKKIYNIIELIEKKLTLYESLKKYLLQNLFPSDGESIPNVRFADFSGNWELRKLGKVDDVKDGTHDSPKYQDSGYPLITSKNLKPDGLDFINASLISKKDFDSINKRSKVDKNDILFGMIGTIGNPVLVESNDFAIKNVALLKEVTKDSNKFLIQLLKSNVFTRYINKENTGGTQKFLSLNKIRSFEYYSPSLLEQKQISLLLYKMDEYVSLNKKQLTIYESIKKYYIKKLFI